MRIAKHDSGFTLVELMVAMVIAEVVAVIALATTFKTSAILRGRFERAGAMATLRAARGMIGAELVGVGRDSIAGFDLSHADDLTIDYRAHRGIAVVCRFTPDSILIDRDRVSRWRARLPEAERDSLLVYAVGDSARAIDGWLPVGLASGPRETDCPSGRPALGYSVAVDSNRLVSLRLGDLTIARVFETARLRFYGAGSTGQVGYEGLSAGAAIQPFAGPLRHPGGFRLEYLDRTGSRGSSWQDAVGVVFGVVALGRREVAAGMGRASPSVDSADWSIRFENAR